MTCRLVFSYEILTPAALNFFVSYADGAVESLWSIDQYFEFVLVLMLSTGLSFQVGVVLPGLLFSHGIDSVMGGLHNGPGCRLALGMSMRYEQWLRDDYTLSRELILVLSYTGNKIM